MKYMLMMLATKKNWESVCRLAEAGSSRRTSPSCGVLPNSSAKPGN